MNRVIKAVGWTTLAGIVLAMLLVAGIVSLSEPWGQHFITVDDEPFTLAFSGIDGLAAFGGVLLAGLVAIVVVPMAVMVPLLIAALVVAAVLFAALLAVTGVAAVVLSPLALLVGIAWLVWRLSRQPAKGAPAASATPQGASSGTSSATSSGSVSGSTSATPPSATITS